jgi:threonine/homoserine/homoserine lactone efflux protein
VFAVLAWDMAVALAIGSSALRQRFARALPSLERLSGVMLIVLAAALLVDLGRSAA